MIRDGSLMALYADDAKLYRKVISHDDCAKLQEALSHANDWSQESSINFNSSKC